MKRKAVLFNDGDRMTAVYDKATLAEMHEDFDFEETILTSKTMQEHREVLRDAEVIFSTWGMPSLTEEQIADFLPSLKAVFYGAGTVQGFARPFLSHGIKVFSAWAANAVPVAEYATAQIVLAGKGFFQGLQKMRTQGRAASYAYSAAFPCNYSIRVGILGCGMIGRMMLERLAGYEYEVLAYDPYVSDEVIARFGARRASLEEIFSTCQTISNHIANLPATVGMLDYDLFRRMANNATFINTGRGAQVVEADLIRALTEQPDRTAVLDVTFPEPPENDSPLLTMDNVFLTPHIAGSMGNEVARMGKTMAQESRAWLRNEKTRYEVSVKMLETMA